MRGPCYKRNEARLCTYFVVEQKIFVQKVANRFRGCIKHYDCSERRENKTMQNQYRMQ